MLRLNLDSLIWRIAFFAAVVALCALLGLFIVSRFAVGTLADYRVAANRDMLLVPLQYIPDSPRLNARLAEAELVESDRDLQRAEFHARQAVLLSPYDFHNRATLAAVKEAQGDRAQAEQQLLEATRLAPHDRSVRWKLANVMLRQGKLGRCLPEFKQSLAGNISYLAGALDLIWRASRGSVDAVQEITGDEARARLTLALFLVRQSRFREAASIFAGIERSEKIGAEETPRLINSLVSEGRYDLAQDMWLSIVGDRRNDNLLSNGGFELDLLKNFSQFDWSLQKSDFAKPAIDTASAHSGSRSLKLEFSGRDTTVLDNEVKQLVPVRPGERYALECWVKPYNLVSPEAPRLVVSDATTSSWLAASAPIPVGSADWQRINVDFASPPANTKGIAAVYVSFKRKPRYSFDEPTKGVVWLDDFKLMAIRTRQ